MKRRMTFGVLLVCLMASLAVAGWTHFNGKTMLVPEATPATIWTRNNRTGELHLLAPSAVQIFDNTIHMVSGGTSVVSYGYWTIDSGNVYHLIAGNVGLYTQRHIPGTLRDVEFQVNATGEFIAKE
jgi:hypothetical protein